MSEPTEEGYAGPATVLVDGSSFDVEVTLRGQFQPIDGRYHWYGRIGAHPDLGAGARVLLSTPHGQAEGRLSDVDPWGRVRIAGTGTPPYALAR